jgi:hypothetical protein
LWLQPFLLWGLLFNYAIIIADGDYRWKKLLVPTLVLVLYFGAQGVAILTGAHELLRLQLPGVASAQGEWPKRTIARLG